MSVSRNILRNSIEFLRMGKHHFDLWQILLSVSLTAGSVMFLFYQILSMNYLSLRNFNDRTIGIVILTATDASHRTSLYIGIWIVAFLMFCILLLIFAFINKNYINQISIEFEKELLFYLSLISIASLFLYALSLQQVFLTDYKIFLVLLSLVGIILLIKYCGFVRKKPGISEVFSIPSIIVLSFVVPYISIFIYWIVFDREFLYSDIHLYFYAIIWAIFIAGYYSVSKYLERKKITLRRMENSLIKSIIPLLLIPLIIPLSNEFQYTLSRSYHIFPNNLAKLFVILLMGISICIFGLTIKRQSEPQDRSSYVKIFYFPLILISVGLFQYYHQFLNLGTYDIFHQGELLISPQQLFVFHSLPFVNIFPTHGLIEMSYQVLYSIVNGYTPIQSLLWDWIPILIGMAILYFVLSKITTPVFAFLMCLFLPIFSIINSSEQYLFCLLPVFTLCWLIKKPDFFRFCVHWLIILFLFLWRLDFGAAAFVGTVFILIVILLKEIIYSKNIALTIFKTIVKSFIYIYGIAFTSYCILLFVCNQNILDTLLVNVQMCIFQAPVQAYPTFFNNLSFGVILEYVIFPIVALIFVISFVFDKLVRNQNNNETRLILTFLAVTTLTLSIRTVQRHSMVEEFNAILYPLLLILLPLNFEIRKKQIQHIAIVILFLIYIVAVPSFSIIFPSENTKFFESHNWTNKENRIISNQSSYQNLITFMGNSLTSNETFYDFSNAPLVYIFTNKEFIPYLIPNIYQSSEIIQKDTLEKLEKNYQQKYVPIVNFKQGNGWDYVDNVPNEVRSYRIAEYIYLHYRPVGYIDNRYQIWIADNAENISIQRLEQQQGFTPSTTISQIFDLQKLPYIWGTYDPLNAVSKTVVLENVTNNPVLLKSNQEYFFLIKPDFDKTTGNYLYLRLRGTDSSRITVGYGEKDTNSFSFSTEPTSKYENYLVRVSTQWEWMNSDIDKISITSNGDLELSEMNIRKGD